MGGRRGRYGIDLEPNRPNADGPEPRDRHGVAVTYQTVAAGPQVHARRPRRRRDAADRRRAAPHGRAGRLGPERGARASTPRGFRLLLSGTPFRSDNTAIPWVRYDDDCVSAADYSYSYTDALVDGVCRPITFLAYGGEMEWVSDGQPRRADFDVALPRQEAARRLRTALDADGDWIGAGPARRRRAALRVRAAGHPDAGGLVVAADKEHARGSRRLARDLRRAAAES